MVSCDRAALQRETLSRALYANAAAPGAAATIAIKLAGSDLPADPS